MFRLVFWLSVVATLAQAATPGEIAEWAIRSEGCVTLEGNRQPLRDYWRQCEVDLKGTAVSGKGVAILRAAKQKARIYYGPRDAPSSQLS